MHFALSVNVISPLLVLKCEQKPNVYFCVDRHPIYFTVLH